MVKSSLRPAAFVKWWQERIVAVIIAQLVQGVSPQKIALSISLGLSLGIFPILGTTTALCAIAAVRLRLNQPIIQLVNWLVYPLQLGLVLVFIRIGEWMTHAPPVNFSIPEIIAKFHESPAKFLQDFGMSLLHGVIAWLFLAPLVTAITYAILAPSLKGLADLKNAMADSSKARP